MRIVFFGAAKFVLPIIEMLNTNFDLALVVTTERNPLDNVPAYCKKNNIPYVSIKNFSECLSEVKKTGAEVGILASFGLLLPSEALNIFPKGILNIHPSLLPKYRGAMPVQTAILNGDTETGVTIIKLDEELDHGPILEQEKEKISSTDTTASLHDKLFVKGTKMLEKIIPGYLQGKIKLQEQQHEDASFTDRNLTRENGYFDIENPPQKEKLDRMIRAYYPWPTVWTKIRIKNQESRIKFLPAPSSLRAREAGEAIPYLIQVEGKKPVSIKDFLNGYPETKKIIEELFS